MTTLVRPLRFVVVPKTYLRFVACRDPQISWLFPCSDEGVLRDPRDMSKPSREALADCARGHVPGIGPVTDGRLVTYQEGHRIDAIVRCDCGAEVTLDAAVVTCPGCGADHYSSGVPEDPATENNCALFC